MWSPQYSLWLVPLAVLAYPRWRPLLAWMALDAFVWVPRMYFYLGTGSKGLPPEWFYAAVVVRDLAVVGLAVLVVRTVLRPGLDPVRRRPGRPGPSAPGSDPDGGVLDGAPDAAWFTARQPPADAPGRTALVGTTRSGRT